MASGVALLVFGLLVGLSSVTLFEAYRYMDAGIASTLLFVYPLMVAIIMSAVFHERLKPVTIFSLATALVGIGLLYKGEGGATLSVAGTALVMLSALSYALYIVGINKTGACAGAYIDSDLLCAYFRIADICGKHSYKRASFRACGDGAVESYRRASVAAYGGVISLHHARHYLYRLNTHGDTRGYGAADRCRNRGHGIS